MMDDVKLRYESVLFDGSFMNKSVYQQPAGPEVDAAWSGLGIDFRTIVVPEDRGFEAGLDPSAVKVKKSQGGGYLVNVEGLHHLHCLVSLCPLFSKVFFLAALAWILTPDYRTKYVRHFRGTSTIIEIEELVSF